MFQASSVYKICKWNQRAAFGNYSGSAWLGSAWLTCDYKAISVQLQLQLPTGTELGNKSTIYANLYGTPQSKQSKTSLVLVGDHTVG